MKLQFLLNALLALQISIGQVNGDCEIDARKDFVQNQPLYLVPQSNTFWRTTVFGQMVIKSQVEIKFYCPDGFARPFSGKTHVLAACVDKKTFFVDGNNREFKEFVCKAGEIKNPKFSAIRAGTCKGGQLLKAGYPDSNSFIEQMDICFDPVKEQTLYVHHNIESDKYQNVAQRDVLFHTAAFFGAKDVNKLYSVPEQKKTLGRILGESEVSKYINDEYALSRGHLAAKSDFVFDNQQRTTFLFVNMAPQWKKFNSENWDMFERAVQTLAKTRSLQLECYTGTFGVITLPDHKGNDQEIYLFNEQGKPKQIPVPKLYFRVVLEPLAAGRSKRKGVVIVGVNNPHINQEQLKEYILCDDVIDQIGWFNRQFKDKMRNMKAGYLYACKVEDFKKKITFLPELNVDGLLDSSKK